MRKQRETDKEKPRCEAKASEREAALRSTGSEPDRQWGRVPSLLRGRDKARLQPKCICKDPKDGELRSGRPKPDESPVEGRRDSDVQIDRPT